MKRYCLALDLVEDAALIKAYEHWHQPENVWPEIIVSLKKAGILNMEIYRTGNRLLMIMETMPDFSFETKAAIDNSNEKVQEWEELMGQFQQPLPWAKANEKWVEMKRIFKL